MTTEMQADLDSLPAADVVAATVKVPYQPRPGDRSARRGQSNALATPPVPDTLITFIEEFAPHVHERVTERPTSLSPPQTSRGADR